MIRYTDRNTQQPKKSTDLNVMCTVTPFLFPACSMKQTNKGGVEMNFFVVSFFAIYLSDEGF